MVQTPARQCKYPRCPKYSSDGTGYCPEHARFYIPFNRPVDERYSASRRGYGRGWRVIRERILAAYGIPRERWIYYDVDHVPAYDPEREPDHNKYQLIPRLHAEHSRKTVLEDGGWGNRRTTRGEGRQSLVPSGVDRLVGSDTHTENSELRGCP